MAEAVAGRSVRPPVWRNVRVLRAVGQIVFVLLIVIFLREIYLNANFNLQQQGKEISYDFLERRAGFEIKEGISYSPNEDLGKAFTVGVANALTVALVGIVLATLFGLIIGVARLSPNWLMRKIMQVYVEVIRNTPLLVQVVFWWAAVFLSIPAFDEGLKIADAFFVSNRGAAIPAIRGGEDFGMWLLLVLLGVVAAFVVARWRTKVHEATGRRHYRTLSFIAVLLTIAVIGAFLGGDALSIEDPELGARDYIGGLQMSPEFAAILVALVVYTAAFIGEIVRGSILAVSKGQKEAAEALGLRPGQQLRLVVIPQALRIAIPPINNQYLNLWKNTSLAFAIGFPDIINISTTTINQAGHELEVFSLVVITYLAISLLISVVMNIVNRAVALKGGR